MISPKMCCASWPVSKNGALPRRVKLFLSLCRLPLVIVMIQPACAGKEDAIKASFRGFSGKYALYVSKKNFTLEVYDRTLRVAARYRIAYGSNPDLKAKLHEGDNRTPEGLYHVNEILSIDDDKKSSSYKKLRKLNQIFFRARDGHSRFGEPGVDQGDNAYGPRYFGLDYPNRRDVTRYRSAVKSGAIRPASGPVPKIGHGIAIHGNNDENSIGHPASSGCIRMYNRDIIECEQYIQMGTPAIISAD